MHRLQNNLCLFTTCPHKELVLSPWFKTNKTQIWYGKLKKKTFKA